MTAKEIAISLIKPYVDRGDDLESLKGFMGIGCADFDVAIGGHAWNEKNELIHKGKRDEIVVSKMEGKNVCYIFKLEKLFNEIKSGQQRLL